MSVNIKVKPDTKATLERIGSKGETFDDVIARLLALYFKQEAKKP
jgi:hypothetical protein